MKGYKGITLIALIITIIVMLILAGVVISMMTNDSGVIARAEKANATMEQKNIEETIQTSYHYDKDNAGNLEYGETKEAIEKNLKAAGYTVNVEDSDFPITVKVTGKTGTYSYSIKEKGNIENKEIISGDPLEVIGKYYYLSNSLELKEDEKAILTQDGNNFETTYTYNENTNIVEIMGQEFLYIKDGNNKMLRCDDSYEDMILYATEGTDSFPRPQNGTYQGTYEEEGITYQVKVVIEDGKINYYKNENPDGEDFDSIVYDGKIYYVGNEGFYVSRFKISEDSNTLTGWYKYKDAVLTKQEDNDIFYGEYFCYSGGDCISLEIIKPDNDGKLIATLMGENGAYTYNSIEGTGTFVFETLGMNGTFEQRDIVDENGKIINPILLVNTGEGNLIFSRYGGIDAIKLNEKIYKNNAGYTKTFYKIVVNNLEICICKDYKNGERECHVLNGNILYEDGYQTGIISSDYTQIDCSSEKEGIYYLVE